METQSSLPNPTRTYQRIAPPPTTYRITPQELGITNPKFAQFRDVQIEGLYAITTAFEAPEIPVAMLGIPTGGGKYLLAFAIGKLFAQYGLRTLILSHTKGLQDQADADSSMDGLQIMKGRSNYNCIEGGDCESGVYRGCSAGQECTAKLQQKRCLEAQIVFANYSYWVTVNRHLPGMNPIGTFDIVILDEGHLAPRILSDHLTVEITPAELATRFPIGGFGAAVAQIFPDLIESPGPRQHIKPENIAANVEALKTWAVTVVPAAVEYQKARIEEFKAEPTQKHADEVKKGAEFLEELKLLRSMSADNWVVDRPAEKKEKETEGAVRVTGQSKRVLTIKASPLWVGAYNHYLFNGATLRVIMSATLLPDTGIELGIPIEKIRFKEWPRVFPNSRNPVYHVRTGQLKYETENDPATRRAFISRIADIAHQYSLEKGIIHTVSYTRMDWMYEWLMREYPGLRDRIMRHEKIRSGRSEWRETGQQVVDRYIKSQEPKILLSPVLTTGWDFKDDQCRFIIVPKLPFQPAVDLVTKCRKAKDPSYLDRYVAIELTQGVGRGSRSETDWCASYLLDDAWEKWFEYATRNKRPKSLIVQCVGPQLPKRLYPI